jgi:hypothetical protein
MEFPLYILEGEDVDTIGIVEQPAIEREFMAFSKQPKVQVFSEQRQLLAGFAMIADLPIPRINPETGEKFYVSFPKRSIFNIVEKLKANNKTIKFNLNHDSGKKIEAFLFMDFIIDSQIGITTPKGFKEATDGSWFIVPKIPNNEDFEYVKNNMRGFSIEGSFTDVKEIDEEEIIIEKLIEKIQQYE